MYSTIIFLSITILFLSLLLIIDVGVMLDVANYSVKVNIKVYKIKIITIDINVLGLFYKINKSNKKNKINILITKEQKYLFEQIKSSILDKLYYDSISFKSEINIAGADVTANTIGIINLMCLGLKEILLSHNPDMSINYSNSSNLVGDVNRLCLDIRVYFTVFDLLFAIIVSFYKRGQYVKERKYKGGI